jgi:ubiquinone/menaquinone biosynthesis C-methylase UbiE
VPGRLYEATWGRLSARCYDWFMRQPEEGGLREMRRELLSTATGRCLEIGAGTGLNLDLWPPQTDLVLTEPDPNMVRQLRPKLEQATRRVELVEAGGERLPFPDSSFDTVALTLVLCTAPDPAAVLREVSRVLRPGGRFLFLEHVRSEDPKLARWQDRLHGPWYFFGDGCHCNRDTQGELERSALQVERLERGKLPKAPPIVRPLVRGAARAP